MTDYHITIDGRPLCQCESHVGGLLGNKLPGTSYHFVCETGSAKQAAAMLDHIAKDQPGREVAIVAGSCPAYPGAEHDNARITYTNRAGLKRSLGPQAIGVAVDGNLAEHGIPDLWHIAQAITAGRDFAELDLQIRERFADGIVATWHLAHDLANAITREDRARIIAHK